MAISATKSATTTASAYPNINYTITAYWIENSTSMSNNTSQITVKATFKTGNANFDVSGAGKLYIDWYDNKNGWQTAKASKSINSCSFNTSYSCSATFNVEHKSDGSLSGYARARWDKLVSSSYVPSDKSVSTDNKALTTIKRYPVISAGQNFTDETDSVTITYTNPSKLYPVRLKLEAGGNPDLIVRDFDKTSTSGRIDLTEAEKNTLRALTPNSNTLTVRETVRAMSGETPLSLSYKDYTMTIVNANPTMEQRQIIENNTDVISYLGSSSADTVVKNASNVTISVTPIAYKSATISSVVINHNGVNINATESSGVYSATFDVVADTTTITTTDSRGNTVSEVWEPNVIEYQKVKQNSFSFKRVNPTSSNIAFTLDSLYYQQTFGSTANVPTIRWKLDNGSWNTLSSSQYTIDTTNNKVTVNTTLNNVLSYMNSGTMYVEVSDLLSTWTNSMNVTKGIPVFEFGEDDVQVNGDLYIADTNRENKINVKDILKSSNYIVAGMTSSQQASNNTIQKLRINKIANSNGTLLTLDSSNYEVVIGAGVHNVQISGQMYIFAFSGNGARNIYIYKNNTNIARALIYIAQSYQTVGIATKAIPVQEGDRLSLMINSQGGTASISEDTATTYLFVKVID